MSYFNSDDQANQTGSQQQEDFVKRIVEEKGEQWQDPQFIAKGYVASQEHITKLQLELKAMQEKVSGEDYMKKVLEQIEASKTPAVGEQASVTSNGTATQTDQSGVTMEQIKELVKETLTSEERTKTAQQNIRDADAKLTELFGTEAAATVEKRRQELGLDKANLMKLAEESPTAFLTLIGVPPKKETNQVVGSTLNTEGSFNQSSERNFAFYQKIRKDNPSLYKSAKVQNQMVEDRIKLGEGKFYSK